MSGAVAPGELGLLSPAVAIVSGALGDIGRAVCDELAARGAAVAAGDLRPKREARPLLASLAGAGVRVRYDRVDVTDGGAVREWVAAVEADLGLPTIVVPNAAVVTVAGIRAITSEEWTRQIAVNLTGAFHLARAGADRLVERETPGRIVFVGSWAADAPHPHVPAYCVSKAGLRMLCRCMALELAGRGILVNEVAPGYVDAGLSGRMFEADPGLRVRAAAATPVRRLIEPAEVAMQVADLCDRRVRHITGATLLMDGGLSLVTPAAPGREP